MTTTRKQTTKQQIGQLEKKIAERLKFLTQIVDNAMKVLFNLGRQTYSNQGSCHTHTKHEFFGGDFEIDGDFGQSMMGGNNLNIKYQKQPVFDVYWQAYSFNGNDGKIKLLNEGVWQDKLSNLATKAKEKKEKEVRKEVSKLAEEKKLKELRLQAEKLGLPKS